MIRTPKSKETIIAIESKTKKPKTPVSAKTSKPIEKKLVVSAPKIKPLTSKTKSIVLPQKKKIQTQKTVPPVSVQQTKYVKTKNPITVSFKLNESPIKKVKPEVANAKTKSIKTQPIILPKQSKRADIKLKVVENKVQKPKTEPSIKIKSQIIKNNSSEAKTTLPENNIESKNAKLPRKSRATKVVKTFENKVEPIKTIVERKQRKKKVKPISSAIFRGKKDRYGFEVFPIDAEIEDVSAIYVISKRKTDKLKKGHHSLVCIGQTESVLGEIKRHKKGKCVKKHQANVISILPEADEKKRLRIETDLKAAHTIVCSLE